MRAQQLRYEKKMQEEESFNRNVSVSDDSDDRNTMTPQPETEDGKQGRSSLVTFRTTKEPSFDDESVLVVSYKDNSRDSETLESEESTDIIGSSRKEFKIARKWIMNCMIDKKQESKSYSMKVASPTVIKASETWIPLTLEVIPYVNESTEWPDRFSYLKAHLKIPHNLVFLLTISHHCTLHLAISVSADNPASPLLDLPRPLQLKFPVPQGVLEYTTEMTKFLRHTTLIDASCKSLKCCVTANFEVVKNETLRDVTFSKVDDFESINAPPHTMK